MKKLGVIVTALVLSLAMVGCKINKEDFDKAMSAAGIETPDSICSSIASFDYNYFNKLKADDYDKDAFKEAYGLEMDKNKYLAGYFIMSDDKTDADNVYDEYGAYLEKNGFEKEKADEDSTVYFNGTSVVLVWEVGPFSGDYDEKYHGKYGINVTLENSVK